MENIIAPLAFRNSPRGGANGPHVASAGTYGDTHQALRTAFAGVSPVRPAVARAPVKLIPDVVIDDVDAVPRWYNSSWFIALVGTILVVLILAISQPSFLFEYRLVRTRAPATPTTAARKNRSQPELIEQKREFRWVLALLIVTVSFATMYTLPLLFRGMGKK